MSRRRDGWVGWTTTGCVALLAVIAGTVSYLHMHQLVAGHGQPRWVTPLSVDGMIVAASTGLLADSRSGGRDGLLPWDLNPRRGCPLTRFRGLRSAVHHRPRAYLTWSGKRSGLAGERPCTGVNETQN
jgi:hypothetical protein